MNVKKEVFERVKQMLTNERNKCLSKIRNNKWEFEKLTNEQTVLKRELAKIDEMIRSLQ